ncbi:MAG TPA: hypothetical protein VIQ30_24235 [Pseudonocardia sp.]
MSLLSNGPHTVKVYLEETVTDFHGNLIRRPSATPVTVTGCFMQPVASARGAFAALKVSDGQQVLVAYKLIARNAPVGWWSRVEWVDEDGVLRKFSVLGGPQRRTFSGLTGHVSCTLREER